MDSLVKHVMHRPLWAVLVAFLFACLPATFWLSSAVVVLVFLRRGIDKGLPVFVAALLPALFWSLNGQILGLVVLSASMIMALILRETGRWNGVLSVVVPLGFMLVLGLDWLKPMQINIMVDVLKEVLRKSNLLSELPLISQDGSDWGLYIIIGFFSWFCLVGGFVTLCLARFWQAKLYYPGGFGREFRKLRLSPGWIVLLLMSFLGMMSFPSGSISAMLFVITLPFFIVGLSIMHSLSAYYRLGHAGGVFFYLLLFLLIQFIYPLLVFIACLDGILDFRSRLLENTEV